MNRQADRRIDETVRQTNVVHHREESIIVKKPRRLDSTLGSIMNNHPHAVTNKSELDAREAENDNDIKTTKPTSTVTPLAVIVELHIISSLFFVSLFFFV